VAKLNAARVAVQAAAAMVHGSALARANQGNIPCPATGGNANVNVNGTGTICTETGTVAVVNWYPQATVAAIIAAAGLSNATPLNNAALQQEGYNTTGGGAAAGAVLTIQVTGGANAAQCIFTYSPSNAGVARTAAQISPVTTTGC